MLAHNREALFEGGQGLFGVLRVVSIQAEFGDTPRLLSDALLSYMNMLAREFQRGFGGNHKVIVALRPINSGGNRTRFALRFMAFVWKWSSTLKQNVGFVLLPRRWVVERSFAWAARFRRRARDYERLAQTLAGFHYLAFASLMLHRLIPMVSTS
jgi:transposase